MAKETLYDKVVSYFPELEGSVLFTKGIFLKNDSDETGDYIASWDYKEAIPEELKSYLR